MNLPSDIYLTFINYYTGQVLLSLRRAAETMKTECNIRITLSREYSLRSAFLQ